MVAPPEMWAIGLVTRARARSLADGRRVDGATFVHLLDRGGTSVSVLRGAGSEPVVTGPGPDRGEGRVPDLCRRMLGMPTPAPPGDMTAHVADLWLARARLGAAMDAVRPTVADDAAELLSARHPLLGAAAVPIDIRLGDRFGYRALVVTGPNTGGKTVSLKTLGLLALMHQAGMRVPAADGARLPVFRRVMADIGDEQSIAQSLSTFSSHLRNVVRFVAEAGPATLVLLDEIGAGTDPAEGSALAMAILSRLLDAGAMVAATTHYAELKTFATEHPGVSNAAVEFDVTTLRPTYRLTIGLPGKSGVGGGIVTVSPGKGGLGTFSPRLDAAGNSVRGALLTKYLSDRLGLNIYASSVLGS